MKALLLPLIMLLAGLGAGVGAGLFLAPPEEAAEAAHGDTGSEDHGEQGHRDGKDGEAGEGEAVTDFARLSNQFIVPVVKGEKVNALVVLSITLEVDAGGTETVFAQEPRLRDKFLQVLFDHANVGGFDAGFTQAGTMAILRNALKETARAALGPLVHDVLIVDIVRQEV
jgi:flagellar protein FliL